MHILCLPDGLWGMLPLITSLLHALLHNEFVAAMPNGKLSSTVCQSHNSKKMHVSGKGDNSGNQSGISCIMRTEMQEMAAFCMSKSHPSLDELVLTAHRLKSALQLSARVSFLLRKRGTAKHVRTEGQCPSRTRHNGESFHRRVISQSSDINSSSRTMNTD